jgi:hypothetical protein
MILFLTMAEEQGRTYQPSAQKLQALISSIPVDAAVKHSKHTMDVTSATERRIKRPRVSDPPQKMITRNRGKRTTSYRAILNKPKRKPLPTKRVTVPSVPHKFHGVVLPNTRRTLAFRKPKRQRSPQESGVDQEESALHPMSDADIDAPHDIDEGERPQVSEQPVRDGSEKGKCDGTLLQVLLNICRNRGCVTS